MVSCACYMTNGDLIASGSWDRTVRIWDLQTGTTLLELTGETLGSRVRAFEKCIVVECD